MSVPKRNLLLCFDAFGTLFRPKRPIEQQYGDVARQCLTELARGEGDSRPDRPPESLALLVTDEAVRASFRKAFHTQSRMHPNYGNKSCLGAAQWWTNVIQDTYAPLLAPAGVTVPPTLAPRLLHRFSSREGYAMAPRLPALLRALKARPRALHRRLFDQIVVGVITNSDDRTPDILASFGLRVGPLRFSQPGAATAAPAGAVRPAADDAIYDIDFHCMSYDVGFEKPDERIFRAAEAMLAEVLAARRSRPECASGPWDKMHVGDDYAKDVIGAQTAGWLPVFVSNDKAKEDVWSLDGHGRPPPAQAFEALHGQAAAALQVSSAEALIDWLTDGGEGGVE